MTSTADADTWTPEPEPDWLLDAQAAEHTGTPATTKAAAAPPHDTAAEEAVLGAMLLNARAVDVALARIQHHTGLTPTRAGEPHDLLAHTGWRPTRERGTDG